MWLKKLVARRRKPAAVAAASVSAPFEAPIIPLAAITDVVLPQPAQRDRAGHLGMQGYAPIVKISKNRRYCEFCAERVLSGVMHICWGNVEHHMHRLTSEDRTRILAQLASKPRKPTRAQLRKLYSSDGLGTAEY